MGGVMGKPGKWARLPVNQAGAHAKLLLKSESTGEYYTKKVSVIQAERNWRTGPVQASLNYFMPLSTEAAISTGVGTIGQWDSKRTYYPTVSMSRYLYDWELACRKMENLMQN